jgi:hypothetical protein
MKMEYQARQKTQKLFITFFIHHPPSERDTGPLEDEPLAADKRL